MDLRHTIRKKDGKVHRYWCLVRSVRVGRRVIRQTVAQQLGELDEHGRLEAQAQHLIGTPEQAQLFDDGVRDVRRNGAGAFEGYPPRALAPVWRRLSGAGIVA